MYTHCKRCVTLRENFIITNLLGFCFVLHVEGNQIPFVRQ